MMRPLLLAFAAAAALGIGACTKPAERSAERSAAVDAAIPPENHLPVLKARDMSSPVRALGCAWEISFESSLIDQDKALLARCEGIAPGAPYRVQFIGHAAEETGANRIRLRVKAADVEEDLVVQAIGREPTGMLFSGETTNNSVVPRGGVVETRFILLGCETDGGVAAACPVVNAGLAILSRR